MARGLRTRFQRNPVIAISPSCPALVIHDDDDFRRSLVRALDEQHFTVTVAEDGQQAIDLLEQRHFRVVLVGMSLATGKGLESAGFLRTHDGKTETTVIVIGESSPQLRAEATMAAEVLFKPVDPAWVASRARSYCE